jgi:hypothetical protein
MLFSGAWGKMIHEKFMKQKISRHCPFNYEQKLIFPVLLSIGIFVSVKGVKGD